MEVFGVVETRMVETIGEKRRRPSANANPVKSNSGAKTFLTPGTIAPPKVGSKKYFWARRHEKTSCDVKNRFVIPYSTSFVFVIRSTSSTIIVFRNRSAPLR